MLYAVKKIHASQLMVSMIAKDVQDVMVAWVVLSRAQLLAQDVVAAQQAQQVAAIIL